MHKIYEDMDFTTVGYFQSILYLGFVKRFGLDLAQSSMFM